MEATRGQSSTQHPTIMELQRLQLEALQSGDRERVSELQERIFYPLVSGRDGGSGLGLTLAQNFISQHHGTVTFESSPGKTFFSILLPVNDE